MCDKCYQEGKPWPHKKAEFITSHDPCPETKTAEEIIEKYRN